MHGRHDSDRKVPPAAVWGSVGLHGAMFAVFVWLSVTTTPPLTAQTYQVRLIAAADLQAPLRDTPVPPRQAEEENRPPPPQPTEDPIPETELPSVVEEVPRVDEPVREPARADETGDEALNVQTEGARFVDPEYANTIVRQINRYWRPPDTSRPLEAEITFIIDRSGEVSEVRWLRRSGSTTFDLEARGAIEAAAREDAFGPLPDAFPFDELQVSFYFDPSSR
ncbi:MAG: TonB C-terminal domain-containing protein [Gemmatimonadota bacterium]